MREPAVMSKTEDRSAKITQHVDVGSFGRECQRGRGQRRLAIQPGATKTRASQEMGDGFQIVRILCNRVITDRMHCKLIAALSHRSIRQTPRLRDAKSQGISNVKASGTTLISAGSVPSNSPSASTKIREFTRGLPFLGRLAGKHWQLILSLCARSIPRMFHFCRSNPLRT